MSGKPRRQLTYFNTNTHVYLCRHTHSHTLRNDLFAYKLKNINTNINICTYSYIILQKNFCIYTCIFFWELKFLRTQYFFHTIGQNKNHYTKLRRIVIRRQPRKLKRYIKTSHNDEISYTTTTRRTADGHMVGGNRYLNTNPNAKIFRRTKSNDLRFFCLYYFGISGSGGNNNAT